MKTSLRNRVRPFLMVLSVAVIPLLCWAEGCVLQSEGERCDHQNGDADCATGLVCTLSTTLGGSADICCPPSGTSQNPECIPGGGTTAASSTSASTTSTVSATSSASTSAGTSVSSSSTSSASATSSSTSSATTTSSSSSSGSGGGGGGM